MITVDRTHLILTFGHELWLALLYEGSNALYEVRGRDRFNGEMELLLDLFLLAVSQTELEQPLGTSESCAWHVCNQFGHLGSDPFDRAH